MPNHDWINENLNAYLAGGLSAQECREVEQHITTCAECPQALADARKLDQSMDDLFAGARPDAKLEDRAVAKLRQSRVRRASLLRFVAAAAAVLVLGLVGSAVQMIAFADSSGEASGTVAENKLRKLMHGHTNHGENASDLAMLVDESRSMDEADRLADTYYNRDRNDRVEDVRVSVTKVPMVAGSRVQFAPVHVSPEMKWAVPNSTFGLGFQSPNSYTPYKEEIGKQVEGEKLGKMQTGMEPDKRIALVFNVKKNLWGETPPPDKAEKFNQAYTAVGTKIGTAAGGEASVKKPEEITKGATDYFLGARSLAPHDKKPGDGPGDQAPDGSTPAPKKPAPVNLPEPGPVFFPEVPALPKQNPAAETGSKIIRTGEMEFEVDSFDRAVKKVNELIAAVNDKVKDGAAASKNDSKKLENGKMRGYVVVRIRPERLDKFIDDLRSELGKFGDLKTQHVSSADVTLHFTDTESELKAARAVEKNLLAIIDTKKGDIKDLVAAEATLGTWRTKIEKLEGQMRVLRDQIALSTLTITLVEKDIGTPASLVVSEKVQMRIEVDDVKKALENASEALKAVKGRVLKSELKQHKAGQFAAILHAEVPPAVKDVFEKQLSALGIVTENEATKKTQAEGGSGKPGDITPRISDVVFEVALNNIVNVEPRHSVVLVVASSNVPTAYKKLKDEILAIAKSQIRVDQLNEQDKLRITADLQFNVPKDKKKAVDELIAGLGTQLEKTSVQAPVTTIATEQKFGYSVELRSPASIGPRETVTLKVEVKDVDKRIDELKEAVKLGDGRVAEANVIRQENGQVSAVVVLIVPLAVQNLIVAKVKESGNLLHQESVRNPKIPEGNLATARIDVALTSVIAGKNPREKVFLKIETGDVDKKVAEMKEAVKAAQGRVADEKSGSRANGQVAVQVVFDVPLSAHESLVQQFKAMGHVVSYDTARNPQIPDNDLASAQLIVTLANPSPISDEGVGGFARKSLSWSFFIFSWCILAIIAGLSALVPVGAVIYVTFKLIRWTWPVKAGA